ncbi:MAG: hypothetical protein V4850_28430 [Myxococcota bacterium]
MSPSVRRRVSFAAWSTLFLGGMGVAVGIAVAFPEGVLLNPVGLGLVGAIATAPSIVWAFRYGPKPGWGLLLVLVGVLMWPGVAWRALWARSGTDLAYAAWYEEVAAGLETVTSRRVLGMQVSEERTTGLTFEVENDLRAAAMIPLALSLLPLASRRCHVCGGGGTTRLIGTLDWPFTLPGNVAEAARGTFDAWRADPSAPFSNATTAPTRLMLLSMRCNACESASVQISPILAGRGLKALEAVPVSPEALVALQARAGAA